MLAAEIGGVGIALKLLSGVGFVWWILPVGGVVWLILWSFRFSVIEYGLGLLGLVTLSFVYSAWHLSPPAGEIADGLVPSLPPHHLVRYAFLAISILGATVSPYLLNFYSSGTVEEKMKEDELWVNRTTAYTGMCFGGVVSMGALITAAVVLAPRHIIVDSYEQAALMFVPAFGRWAVALFAASLGVGCLGAAVEIALNAGYVTSQVFGWPWGANRPRADAPRFAAAFTLVLLLAVAVALLGFDPLQLTLLAVAFTVVIMPLVVLPFLVLMNDERYVGRHRSGPIGNACLATLTIAAGLFALAVIPLEILGG
jgi:Mn2+/Fe2+ NRAMP family transporter